MKIIKFRGKDIQTGKFIYGDLIHSHSEKGGVLISEERPISTPARWVEYDSVAQLVGYDADGKEIYSDDKIRVYDRNRYPFVGIGIENAEDFFKISEIGNHFDNVKLLKK